MIRSISKSAMWLVFMAVCACQSVEVNVLLCRDFESFGEGYGVSLVDFPGAHGGKAGSLAANAEVTAALRLPPGAYTLVMRSWAPAGDQDAFFVTLGTKRVRRTVPIGKWGAVTWPFEAGKAPVFVLIEGQEPGVIVDRIAVVEGTLADNAVDLEKLDPVNGASVIAGVEESPRFVRVCTLGKELPRARFPWTDAGLTVDFNKPVGRFSGHGRCAKDGEGGYASLEMPDSRFDLDVSSIGNGTAMTVGWWVKPRPAASVWSDQGWHFFLTARPKDGELRIELSRRTRVGLKLVVSEKGNEEAVLLRTRHLDPEKWHHIVASWDLSGERQSLWLLVDGQGKMASFPRVFSPVTIPRLEFGNSPSESGMPFLPMDGDLDGISVYPRGVASFADALR